MFVILILQSSIGYSASNNNKIIKSKPKAETAKIYSFTCKDAYGKDISLSEYKGKVLLIVNTASKCGFTKQYNGLQALYKKYKDKGFEVLAFPCNQFAHQEPGTEKEIVSFCQVNFNTTFKIFKKINVNGQYADPLFKYLKRALPGFITNSIKWNFTKFLIDRHGKPIKRYASTTKPKSISRDIEKLLERK